MLTHRLSVLYGKLAFHPVPLPSGRGSTCLFLVHPLLACRCLGAILGRIFGKGPLPCLTHFDGSTQQLLATDVVSAARPWAKSRCATAPSRRPHPGPPNALASLASALATDPRLSLANGPGQVCRPPGRPLPQRYLPLKPVGRPPLAPLLAVFQNPRAT